MVYYRFLDIICNHFDSDSINKVIFMTLNNEIIAKRNNKLTVGNKKSKHHWHRQETFIVNGKHVTKCKICGKIFYVEQ